MKRKSILTRGINISFLDNEKEGQVLICLHGHYGTGSMFKFTEKIFDGRIILPDQRGHGFSDHTISYTRKDYVEDLKQLIEKLKIENPIILGHSLGGVNAYQYAALYKNVSKLIIEDIGTEVGEYGNPFADYPAYFDTVWEVNKEFLEHGRLLSPYFMENLFYDNTKWKFRFNYNELYTSQLELKGTYWEDWEKIDCPILLIHGLKSWASKTENIKEMAKRNKNVQLKMFENSGHTIHEDERKKFCEDLKEFINIT